MTASQFWAYVAHADALCPPLTLVAGVVIFLSRTVRKFVVTRAGEIAGMAAAAFMSALK